MATDSDQGMQVAVLAYIHLPRTQTWTGDSTWLGELLAAIGVGLGAARGWPPHGQWGSGGADSSLKY
ncbi:hypothetical protein FFI94_031430 [Rhodococcus sp. KBS0724]|uniref:hypothetical protein n=1 Tax=Rhodococcus sp. KBS0724 TaxID=1179674 RepID=UPI00110E556C|nr:hypothetical protein [Rhodococcus sp. KBS0724]TSD40279.1 hypothetical protein FFI94_031430 [Rhodococcus sp. KBS0724]